MYALLVVSCLCAYSLLAGGKGLMGTLSRMLGIWHVGVSGYCLLTLSKAVKIEREREGMFESMTRHQR